LQNRHPALPSQGHAFADHALDQPAFDRNRLSAEKLIVFIRLEQLSASNGTNVALEPKESQIGHFPAADMRSTGEKIGFLLEPAECETPLQGYGTELKPDSNLLS
jgi:hypothetical protein